MLAVILNQEMFVTDYSETFHLPRDAYFCSFALKKEALFANSLIFFYGAGGRNRTKHLSSTQFFLAN